MRDTCVTLASYRCRAASKPRLLNLNDVDMAAAHLGHALLSSSAHTDRVYSTLMLMPQGHALGRHKELVEWADVSISHVLEAIKDPQLSTHDQTKLCKIPASGVSLAHSIRPGISFEDHCAFASSSTLTIPLFDQLRTQTHILSCNISLILLGDWRLMKCTLYCASTPHNCLSSSGVCYGLVYVTCEVVHGTLHSPSVRGWSNTSRSVVRMTA
ncbi:hypothetical protein C8Q72DRAFT_152056 [Fomitopsis betulina]|nr:hypothetical protein C8Q72DRAFT_152056 [Fomitopsis betulina]